jgi:predicted dehydrogenase
MSSQTSSAAPTGVGIIGLSASGGWAAGRLGGWAAQAHLPALGLRDEVDLVVVAVKVPHHRELILPALEAGKMILCEWPLGNGLAEAEELAAVAEAQGVRTFVGLQARAAPPVRYVRDLIADGYVGEVLSTSIIASGIGWGAESPPDGE